MRSPLLVRRTSEHVAEVRLNRPEVRNAFDDATIRALTEVFTTLPNDPALRAIVLAAEGAAFCAGADLGWMKAMAAYSWEQNRADAQALADMLWSIDSCALPVVARIQGDCYAGGVGLAAVCDIRVASSTVQFCLSEAKLGLLPATIGPYVVRAMGESAARRYFVTAERFDGERAERLGFVHEVVTADAANAAHSNHAALDAKVASIVAAIVSNGPQAVRACKRLVHDVAGQPITEALRADTATRIADIRASDEGRDGVQAFLGKRDPGWRVKP